MRKRGEEREKRNKGDKFLRLRSGGGSQVTTVYGNYGSKNKVEKRERQKESGRCEVPSVAERRFNTVSNIKKLKRKR